MPAKEAEAEAAAIKARTTDEYIYAENDKYVADSEACEPEFWRDFFPTLQPWLKQVGIHLVYFYTGNIAISLTFLYYIAMPFYDKFMYNDQINIAEKYQKKFNECWWFKVSLYLYNFTLLISFIYYMFLFSEYPFPGDDHWIFQHKKETMAVSFPFAIGAGYLTGIGFSAGHELIHMREGYNKFIGSFTMLISYNSHFWDEHVKGHHKYIGTLEDPCFPPVGRNFYYQMVHYYIYSHKSVFQREEKRINKSQPGVNYLSMLAQNAMVHSTTLHLFQVWFIYRYFGLASLLFSFQYSLIAYLILQAGQFVEHYGLQRKIDENGILESTTCMHSWNAPSSMFFYKFQRHSDHHTHAYRPYQTVKKLDLAPYLPYDYTNCIALILCPPWWEYLMHPRLKSLQDARNGIHNPDQWNWAMPKSSDDIFRERVCCWLYFYPVTVALAILGNFQLWAHLI